MQFREGNRALWSLFVWTLTQHIGIFIFLWRMLLLDVLNGSWLLWLVDKTHILKLLDISIDILFCYNLLIYLICSILRSLEVLVWLFMVVINLSFRLIWCTEIFHWLKINLDSLFFSIVNLLYVLYLVESTHIRSSTENIASLLLLQRLYISLLIRIFNVWNNSVLMSLQISIFSLSVFQFFHFPQTLFIFLKLLCV